jgi:hypothetical protein
MMKDTLLRNRKVFVMFEAEGAYVKQCRRRGQLILPHPFVATEGIFGAQDSISEWGLNFFRWAL